MLRFPSEFSRNQDRLITWSLLRVANPPPCSDFWILNDLYKCSANVLLTETIGCSAHCLCTKQIFKMAYMHHPFAWSRLAIVVSAFPTLTWVEHIHARFTLFSHNILGIRPHTYSCSVDMMTPLLSPALIWICVTQFYSPILWCCWKPSQRHIIAHA